MGMMRWSVAPRSTTPISPPSLRDLVDHVLRPRRVHGLEGKEVVKTGRKIIGATNLCECPPRSDLPRRIGPRSRPSCSAAAPFPHLARDRATPTFRAIRPHRSRHRHLEAVHRPHDVTTARDPSADPVGPHPATTQRPSPAPSAAISHRARPQRHPRLRRPSPRHGRPLVPRGCHQLRAHRQGWIYE